MRERPTNLSSRSTSASGSTLANVVSAISARCSDFNYSLLGDPVNLASRLESLSKIYGLDLVIGEETALRLGHPALIEVDLVAVKGKSRPGRIYTLPSEPIEEGQFINQHSALLTAYRRRVGRQRCAWLMTGDLPQRVISRPFTIFTAGGSHTFRPRPRRPTGTACLQPRKSDGVERTRSRKIHRRSAYSLTTWREWRYDSWPADASLAFVVSACRQKSRRPNMLEAPGATERRSCPRFLARRDQRTYLVPRR